MSSCTYCGEIDPMDTMCGAESGAHVCTRAPGHDGRHVACGVLEHHVAEWGVRADA